VLVVEELAVLLQGELGVARDLGGKRRLKRSALSGQRTGRRFGVDDARLASQPEVAPYGGLGDAEGLGDLSSRGIPRSTAASTLSLRSLE
jgi:hypothetical protein